MRGAGLDPDLPIAPVLPELVAVLRAHGAAVLEAPPGAGKTTQVPLALLAGGIGPGRIVMLEPRRVAARAAADRLAGALGEKIGGRVGFRVRGESARGSAVEVVTEGVLTRMLHADPELAGIGCLIFDEFHERSLQADLGLALALEARAALRPDLNLLVMSATLDAAPVARLIGEAPVMTAQGRAYPVETRWLDHPWRDGPARRGQFEAALADLTLRALDETEGGVLVFAPGKGEIARLSDRLSAAVPADVRLQTLHGGLKLKDQRAVLAPLDAPGRKLVLATAIAETSLTIPDIRVVVDGGQARRARFDPGSGMTRLVTERVTRAEAAQRRGRAGRVAPGWCYRLWSRGEEGALAAFAPPEIETADLAGLALDLALWGAREASGLAFLTPPPDGAFANARALLTDLGALDTTGTLTVHGRALAAIAAHPRMAHMLEIAGRRGCAARAADLAALIAARDPVRGLSGPAPADIAAGLAALHDPDRAVRDHPIDIDRGAVAALRAESARLRRQAPTPEGAPDPLSPGALLSLAYPDRIGKRRAGQARRYLLSGGKGAILPPEAGEAGEMLVAADLDGDPREARIRRLAPVSETDIRALHAGRITETRTCRWSRRSRSVEATTREMLGALVLTETPWTDAPGARLTAALMDGVRDLGLEALPWDGATRRHVARIRWAAAECPEASLPDFAENALLDELNAWLAPFAEGVRRAEDLGRIDLRAALDARLGWEGGRTLDRLAPAAITAPTGTRLPIDYGPPGPSVSVRLQEMFGVREHPSIGMPPRPLIVHLLSPARRPIQTTSDLPGFWETSYPDVRRDLRGRYIKHFWPEDPATATATTRTKAAMSKK